MHSFVQEYTNIRNSFWKDKPEFCHTPTWYILKQHVNLRLTFDNIFRNKIRLLNIIYICISNKI